MKRLIRDFRVLPVVVMAAGCLLVLKLAGILIDGGYIFAPFQRAETPQAVTAGAPHVETQTAAAAQRSLARETLNTPQTTGSSAPKPAEKPAEAGKKPAEPPKDFVDGKSVPVDGQRQLSPGERAVLERLQERRQELEARARELEIRENLLKAAEKRLDAKAAEIRTAESSGLASAQRRDEADAARFKSIVTMYENMKPKDAARIFDRLDMKILLEVASQFNPRKMSDVMAQMSPEAAEKLTVELANRANGGRPVAGSELPKIEGRPNGS